MFRIVKNLNWIIFSSFICIFLGILTFLTFIGQSFVRLTIENLQTLLIIDILFLVIFFTLIFLSSYKIYSANKKNQSGAQTNIKYVSLFALFTLIPSLLITFFSLLLFNFAIQNFFNDQIKKTVDNSYDIAASYLEDSKKTIEGDVLLMSVGINRISNEYYSNINRFKAFVWSEKVLRRVDDIYLIDSTGNIIFADTNNVNEFIIPDDQSFFEAIKKPIIISNEEENKSSAMIKLNNLIDTYLYISRNIDPKIITYLEETKKAVNFYYSVENSQLGIKITFAIIYIIVVTLLLFLSVIIAITFATRLTKPIINLISASEGISRGKLDTKVPFIKTDPEFTKLNENFNSMIDRLKKQQEKLLIAERYSAWESVARKLAHEIKNPLTPIQLSIDRIKEKYSSKINEGREDFNLYLETINRQIKDIENLANEFSNFARMPEPILIKINVVKIISRAVDFFKISTNNTINFKPKTNTVIINGDEAQLYRVFINLIKNSEESFSEKMVKTTNFKGKIDVDITTNNDYIFIKFTDNGTGILDTKKVMTPYFTTKKKGTGLGLPIVSKIINEHSGEIEISNRKTDGVEINITLPKINEK